jgi:cob(I)alamin adenosyltransferase
MKMKRQGLIHVYYGDGKGKTTAALGLALRASGQGFRVVILLFFKSLWSGELAALKHVPGITVLRPQGDGKFLSAMSADEKHVLRQEHGRMFAEAAAMVSSGQCDLLVLDEALDACQHAMLEEDALLKLLVDKPNSLEVVITGHQAIPRIMDQADYITKMKKEKHPYDMGIKGRKGIEF